VIRPSAAVLATTVFLASGWALPGVAYADAFTDTDYYSGGGGGASGPEPCSNVDASSQTPLRPLVPNGPALTGSSKSAGDLFRNSDFSDVIHYDTTVSSTARYVVGPGQPATLTLQGNGSVAVTTDKPTSACRVASEAFMEVDYELTVTAPSLLDASVRTTGAGGRGHFGFRGEGFPNNASLVLDNDTADTTSTGRVFLPPGQYSGYLSVSSDYTGSVAASMASTIDVQAVLHLLGERVGEVTGKGAKYVTLPDGRTCSDGRVPAALTTKRKRVDDISKVEFFVGDTRVKRVTKPKKGKAVSLKAPIAEDVSVRAEVTLDNGKVKVVQAGYVACGT
jgi:hypothetical protein